MQYLLVDELLITSFFKVKVFVQQLSSQSNFRLLIKALKYVKSAIYKEITALYFFNSH